MQNSKRQKEVRRAIDERPPCKICGDNNSTGFHCGTVTCEACKKFFLRNVGGEYKKFACQYARDCIITIKSRTSCQYCRYQKCIAENMRVDEKKPENLEKEKITVECKVCKGPASGYHFGAHTCEGCKGFFRRMIKEGRNLVCQASDKGRCIINPETRNNCKACRYQRCLDAKMDLHHCRIGRQSNLFKQNLRSKLASKLDHDFDPYNQVISQIVMINEPNVGMGMNSADFDFEPQAQYHQLSSLNEFERRLLKKACEAHESYSKQMALAKDTKVLTNESMSVSFDFLRKYADACGHFAKAFFDNTMDQQNFFRIISASVHSLRLLYNAKQASSTNYFDCSEELFEKIKMEFPIFKEVCFMDIIDILRALKMDQKEFALYSALVMFSSGCQCDPRFYNHIASMNTQLCQTLMKYMQSRRKESESCETLINLLSKFAKLNSFLQECIYQRLKQLNFCTPTNYYDNCILNIFYSPCEHLLNE